MMLGQEPRQTTSNLGALNKPSIQVSRLVCRIEHVLSVAVIPLDNASQQQDIIVLSPAGVPARLGCIVLSTLLCTACVLP